jgi:hypothetical protein
MSSSHDKSTGFFRDKSPVRGTAAPSKEYFRDKSLVRGTAAPSKEYFDDKSPVRGTASPNKEFFRDKSPVRNNHSAENISCKIVTSLAKPHAGKSWDGFFHDDPHTTKTCIETSKPTGPQTGSSA